MSTALAVRCFAGVKAFDSHAKHATSLQRFNDLDRMSLARSLGRSQWPLSKTIEFVFGPVAPPNTCELIDRYGVVAAVSFFHVVCGVPRPLQVLAHKINNGYAAIGCHCVVLLLTAGHMYIYIMIIMHDNIYCK